MTYSKIIVPLSALALLLSAVPAAAEVNTSANAGIHINLSNVRTDSSTDKDKSDKDRDPMQRGQERGGNEIDARIASLQKLSARIGDMHRLTADQISALQASVKAQIDVLTSLSATIGNDTSTTSLKADVGSITKAYRIYLLVIPQEQISAAADRILAVAGQMEGLSAKLSARISAVSADGTDVTALNAALSDFNAKVADSKVQANAAVNETVNLKPDNGDASVRASNTAALKDARAKLMTARQDLQAAYKDAGQIIGKVKGKGTASTTVNAHVHADVNAGTNH